MRVIAGSLGGRTFENPHGHRTHPMSEKIRGAIFNALGDIQGLHFLDPFSGSGALAFEAISRGAKSVLALELDQDAFKTIVQNIETLKVAGITALRKNAKSWSRLHQNDQFDVVLCDPPYNNVHYSLLLQLASHTKKGGVLVYSLPPDHTFSLSATEYQPVITKNYGDATLVFYRRIA